VKESLVTDRSHCNPALTFKTNMKRGIQFVFKRKLIFTASLLAIASIFSFCFSCINAVSASQTTELRFPSLDGLEITADSYFVFEPEKAPMVVMFHQANWSRGEFREAGPRFNKMGYNCLAVDLRSGGKVLGIVNETAKRARKQKKPTRFVDAMQDIEATLSYVKLKYNPPLLLVIGSSYSAGLVLKVAGDNPGLMDGVIVFSPAEYFSRDGMAHDWVRSSAKNITIPVFITSARKERSRWINIYEVINTSSKYSYVPATKGKHGARSLWSRYKDSDGYWRVIETFLKSFF
jgi:pimeloyl-ACP methyl ester carboxylesterase